MAVNSHTWMNAGKFVMSAVRMAALCLHQLYFLVLENFRHLILVRMYLTQLQLHLSLVMFKFSYLLILIAAPHPEKRT